MSTQDLELFNLDTWTVIDRKDLFTLQEMKNMPLERFDNSWLMITVEMDLNRMEYARSRFTVLDLLAQFGGFIGIFGRIFGFFMAAWNFNALDNYLVSRLYRVYPGLASLKDKTQSEFHRSKLPHLDDYLMSWVPSCFIFCKARGRNKAKAIARADMAKELDVITVIQN